MDNTVGLQWIERLEAAIDRLIAKLDEVEAQIDRLASIQADPVRTRRRRAGDENR